MKRNILIVMHAMEIGGAERALLGLLEAIDYKSYSVDLFLLRHSGELLKNLPKEVNLLPEISEYACLGVPFFQTLKRAKFGVAWGRFCGKRLADKRIRALHLSGQNDVMLEYSHKYTLPYMPIISEKNYDIAISFLTPHYFTAEKVSARRKLAWIHTDYSKLDTDRESQLAMWDAFNNIISISDSVTQAFLNVYPEMASRIIQIDNIQPKKLILKEVDAFSTETEMAHDGSIRLLSIGRFTNAKNFDNVPDICCRILDAGLDVKWYLIGYGGEEQLIRKKIAEAGMENRVIILGKKENPYPYIKACDLYVQPSRYEGKCVAVREAQMLGKPVVITDFPTSKSQLEDGVDGVIVPMDNEGCANGIAELLKCPERMAQLSAACLSRDYSNSSEVEKLYKLI